ncbi:TetR family transcriptional regulator [Pullulanibacillus camelliae]|uniref:TetR family transcriptional regulator n=1 Tax=Pullulanibacillus camelliae TaxID=1707096 RepID=A0A8J2YGM6_9BACL|nr:TetR/AcrR family transcriptional regulator [Pullulanibacillus camelliae]GGE36874.1 TetR family transcriptional regulator [Pullulanibacillus camelliae]
MKEKKKLIIESAIKLFAENGFHNTSVQEIANHAQMSKGTVYLYFDSKEDLLLKIFYYYYDSIKNKINSINKLQLTPKEKFTKQIMIQFEEIHDNHSFFTMFMREQALTFHDELHTLIKKMRTDTLRWIENSILDIYGSEVQPYIYDLFFIIEGLAQSYFKLIFDQVPLNFEQLAHFIIRRFDDVVQGLLSSGEQPFLHADMALSGLECSHHHSETPITFEQVTNAVNELKEKLAEKNDNEDMLSSLAVLESEMNEETPRPIVIQSMLANIKGDPALQNSKKIIADYFRVKSK